MRKYCMKASIENFHWPDVNKKKETFFPTLMEVYVSISHPKQIIRYEIAVTTIVEMSARMKKDKIASGHGQIVVETFDTRQVEKFIKNEVGKLSGESFREVDLMLRRFGRCELDENLDYWSPSPWED